MGGFKGEDHVTDKKMSTQKLPHDGVGLLQGLGSMGGVKQQPVDDVNLPLVLLSKHSSHFFVFFFFFHLR